LSAEFALQPVERQLVDEQRHVHWRGDGYCNGHPDADRYRNPYADEHPHHSEPDSHAVFLWRDPDCHADPNLHCGFAHPHFDGDGDRHRRDTNSDPQQLGTA
jgi:hypothetical protein